MFSISYVTIVVALMTTLVTASPAPEKRQTLARVVTSCTVANTAALTFDDGPYIYMNDISTTLKNAGVPGTFFVNGNNYGCIYSSANVARMKSALADGHQLASHTWAHKDLTTLTWDQIHDEMWRVENALFKTVGVYPAFMRPPYGNYNNLVRQASAVRGQVIATWDFDSEDSLGATVARSKQLYDQVTAAHPNTILALNHETIETTAHQVLPYAIQKLQAAGYRLVTLAECTGLPAYQRTQAAGVRDSTWVC